MHRHTIGEWQEGSFLAWPLVAGAGTEGHSPNTNALNMEKERIGANGNHIRLMDEGITTDIYHRRNPTIHPPVGADSKKYNSVTDQMI